MISYRKEGYTLEEIRGITIAELIDKLSKLPQDDFCDEIYLSLYKKVPENPIETLKTQISNKEKHVKNAEINLKQQQKELSNLEQKLKELENNGK